MNDENLVTQAMRTKSEQRIIARQGGIASGEARRRKRDARKIMETLLNCKPDPKQLPLKSIQGLGIKGKGKDKDIYTNETIMWAAVMQKAMSGKTDAARLVLEIMGEDPASKRQLAQMEHEKELAAMMREETVEDDGFIEALQGQVTEVFEGAEDEPRNVEDSAGE